MKVIEKSKGITLISLVITIVILLILSGIVISAIVGDGGMLSKIKMAKEENIKAEMKDALTIAVNSIQVEKLGNAKLTDITQESLKPYLQQYEYYVENETENNTKIVTIKKDKIVSTYMIDEKLNITEITIQSENIFTYEINSYENGKVNLTIKIINKIGIKNIIYQKNSKTINGNGQKEVTFEFNDIVEVYNNTNDNEYEFMINLEDGTTETKKIKISLVEVTQDQAEIKVNPSTWTTSAIVEIIVKDTIIKDMSASGLKIQYKEGDYDNSGWIDYTGTFNVDTNKKITARFIDSNNNEGYVFQKEINNVDKVEPQGSISLSPSWVEKEKECKVTINLEDVISGIDFSKSKYIINQTSAEIGKNIDSYIDGYISTSPEEIQVSFSTEGTYYVHVLVTDNAGNSKEIISEGIEVRSEYDDWRTWLYLASIDYKQYSFPDVLSNESLMGTVMANEAAIKYLINSKNVLLKDALNNDIAKEKLLLNLSKIPNMTSSTTPSGEVTGSDSTNEKNAPWCALTGFWTDENIEKYGTNDSYYDSNYTCWITPNNKTSYPAWLQYKFEDKKIVPIVFEYMSSYAWGWGRTHYIKIQGSNDGQNWNDLTEELQCAPFSKYEIYPTKNVQEYQYFRLNVLSHTEAYGYRTDVLKFQVYGTEE